MNVCDLCDAMSLCFNAFRECCQIRLLVGAPESHRKIAYENVRKQGGPAAVGELKTKLRAELARQRAQASDKQARERAERDAKGRVAAAALLNTIRDNKLHLSPLERAAQASAHHNETEFA